MDKHILLFSSGVDSFIAYHYLKKQHGIDKLQLVYFFNSNIKYAQAELYYVQKCKEIVQDELLVLPVKFPLMEDNESFIPARNLLFALQSVLDLAYPEYDNVYVYLGGLRDDRVSDNSPEFAKTLSEVLTLSCSRQINVKSAFDYKLSKSEIVKWFIDNFPDQTNNLVDYTFSCYAPKGVEHCYSCRACFRRNVALQDIILLPFHDRKKLSDWYKDFKKHPQNYDEIRRRESIRYIERLDKAQKLLQRSRL
ncbi:MAG: hypothetical protein DRN14_04180 [Thermoplasmata archaeon]|nr:MAG: hypothetical protein DRN14_04180 [Thermoplasmata archaeon]